MKLLWLTRKGEIILITLIGSLTLWSLVTSILAFQNKTRIVLIGKVGSSFQLITDKEKDPKETINFIRHFLALTLNFDEGSYKRHISLAGDLMTENLWKKKKFEFKEMAGFIKKQKVIQSSEILNITKTGLSQYEIKIRNYLFKKGILTEKDKTILLSLAQNQRSYENPWRFSISNVEIK